MGGQHSTFRFHKSTNTETNASCSDKSNESNPKKILKGKKFKQKAAADHGCESLSIEAEMDSDKAAAVAQNEVQIENDESMVLNTESPSSSSSRKKVLPSQISRINTSNAEQCNSLEKQEQIKIKDSLDVKVREVESTLRAANDECEINTCAIKSKLASKVFRCDSLAMYLERKANQDAFRTKQCSVVTDTLEEMNNDNMDNTNTPTNDDSIESQKRKLIGRKISRSLSFRPTPDELKNRNILHEEKEEERTAVFEEKKKNLERKISSRPTIEELIARKILRFRSFVDVMNADIYDRTCEKPWTALTTEEKAIIRHELNEYKRVEMQVHSRSQKHTRFHPN